MPPAAPADAAVQVVHLWAPGDLQRQVDAPVLHVLRRDLRALRSGGKRLLLFSAAPEEEAETEVVRGPTKTGVVQCVFVFCVVFLIQWVVQCVLQEAPAKEGW